MWHRTWHRSRERRNLPRPFSSFRSFTGAKTTVALDTLEPAVDGQGMCHGDRCGTVTGTCRGTEELWQVFDPKWLWTWPPKPIALLWSFFSDNQDFPNKVAKNCQVESFHSQSLRSFQVFLFWSMGSHGLEALNVTGWFIHWYQASERSQGLRLIAELVLELALNYCKRKCTQRTKVPF